MGEIDRVRSGSLEDRSGGDQDVSPDAVEEMPVRKLPDDLPTSLDDRKPAPTISAETEMYDGWQGVHTLNPILNPKLKPERTCQSQFITTPMPARPLSFNLGLDDPIHDGESEISEGILRQGHHIGPDNDGTEDSDARIVQMLAVQAQHREAETAGIAADDGAIADDPNLSEQDKRTILQKSLNMAASNGDAERARKLLTGRLRGYVDPDIKDEEVKGHEDVVAVLLEAGTFVDSQDRNGWSALMWAMTNRHKTIAKLLLDHGASTDIKSTSGGTASDFVQPGADISQYLHENGYNIGGSQFGTDYYDAGFGHAKFEEEMAEYEMKRRMMMEESALNLEVDLSSLGLDEKYEPSVDLGEEQPEFVWDRCLNDQMFVFQENELDKILNVVITDMMPLRNPSQKPVPANLLFLSARYAHYYATPELLAQLLLSAMDRINEVVERHQGDMTFLAFWLSNATLLLYYLKKDAGLVGNTVDFQLHLAELINDIFVFLIRDAERRMDKVLDAAMLDHETIPGLEDVHFQNEWKLFQKKKSPKPVPLEKKVRPPSPRRRAKISPRNITSLLSSTLFVLDLYEVHSVITTQIISQLLYWIGVELFNRIMTNKKYCARTKAMQIRMNVSAIEDWARTNNREPDHYESGSLTASGESTVESCRKHLAPVVELLQWLQCFSSLGDDAEALVSTLQQLRLLTPAQLIHAVKMYRAEVGEKTLPKHVMKYLLKLQQDPQELRRLYETQIPEEPRPLPLPTSQKGDQPQTPTSRPASSQSYQRPFSPTSIRSYNTNFEAVTSTSKSTLLLDPSLTLPFSLPTSTDMLVTYGAGLGGANREQERKYIPTVPTDFLEKLDRVQS
ncbi:hypothetical protein KEM56_003948 [Ascosphaera pollenicola]|nr:hypothetical protein KEM56_003948 [Ascosphaera pollenicola]